MSRNSEQQDISLKSISNSRLRAIVAIETSRELEPWRLRRIVDSNTVVLSKKQKSPHIVFHFYLSLVTCFLWLIFFYFYIKRKPEVQKVITTSSYPELNNYFDAPFTQYMANEFSQSGEDGIILEILSRTQLIAKSEIELVAVEFGAWDGMHLSNTFSLVRKGICSAYYIEADKSRFEALLSTCDLFPNIIAINEFVDPHSPSQNLDSILSRNGCPTEIDILSIDIDSCDLDVWESFLFSKPKIVVIEVNSSIPPGVILRQAKEVGGNSFSATLTVGKNKGYTLVHHTGNMIFVRNDLVYQLNIPVRYLEYPELLFRSEEIKTFHRDELVKQVRFKRITKLFLRVTFKVISVSGFEVILNRIMRK